jgi:hypothetical protein
VLLDGALGQEQLLSDGGVALALGHLRKDFQLAGTQLPQWRGLVARPCLHQRVDDLWIDRRATMRDGFDRVRELLLVVHPLLEQIGPLGGSVSEQRKRVVGLGELAEHDYAHLRVRLAQFLGDLNSLVGAGRRHADVRHDDVRALLFHFG